MTGEAGGWTGLLRQIIELSAGERDLRTLMRRVADLVVETTGADVCFVHVVDHDARQLVLMGATPAAFDDLAGTIRLQLGEGLAGWVAEHGQAALVEDKWHDARYRYIPALRGEDFVSLLSVPLMRPEGVVVGVLNVHSRQAGYFTDGDAARLAEVASLLAGIVENAVLLDRLATREAELARFAARTIELQELDRRRIAAEIHDGISQRLVSAWYHVRAARSLAARSDQGPDGQREMLGELDSTESLLSDALDETRHAIVGLRPAVLDDLGLAAGIRSLAASLGSDATVDLDLQACPLPAHVETAFYRIAQEALQNVQKHAGADRVVISFRSDGDDVVLQVSDDGAGFDPAVAGKTVTYGLEGMQERAGLVGARLDVRSRPGEGTSITLRTRADHRNGGSDA